MTPTPAPPPSSPDPDGAPKRSMQNGDEAVAKSLTWGKRSRSKTHSCGAPAREYPREPHAR
eukprot:2222239-Rhodomonas_salina.1